MPIVLYLSQRPTKADGEYTGKSSLRFSKSWSPGTTIKVLIAASADMHLHLSNFAKSLAPNCGWA